MSGKRVFTIALRVVHQVIRDRRTIALIVIGPMLVLTLGAVLFRAEPARISVGIVNEDQGLTSPVTGTIHLGQQIVDELAASDTIELVTLNANETESQLRAGTVKAVIVFQADFTSSFVQSKQVVLHLELEGSDPASSRTITALVNQAAMKALASFAGGSLSTGATAAGSGIQPVTVETTYLYGGPEFDTMDYIAPVYIAILGMFFVFLLACVAFLRERSQGTMERLMATPANRAEIVLGYMVGLGIFAIAQVAVILFFTVWVLTIHYYGSLRGCSS